MNVTLRTKPISGNRLSLYLDFYPAIPHPETGKLTRRDFLGLYLFEKPRTELERTHNKTTRQLAESIRSSRQLEVQAGRYGFLVKNDKPEERKDFLTWLKVQAEAEKQKKSIGSRNNWMSVYQHLSHYAKGALFVDELTEEFCKGFRKYLTTAKALNATKSSNATIAHNSAVGYFTIFKTALSRAVEEKLLEENPSQRVKRIKRKETQREFLSLAEVQALAKIDCDLPYLKKAALFSALTGLRYSDIAKLVWAEVRDDADGAYLRFRQKKTGSEETLPISGNARSLLGERGNETATIFPQLLYSSWQNQKLQEWCYKAGIMRPITFHAFRHTFATLQLQSGTDIYTVSKLLGHQDLSTTQIYAKIVNEQKRAAVNRISIEL
ncbi:tyrosine-type recombinase/integrase [Rudanella paleaurantiibacter]|uniref:Tyrosine-type recombinase/integrase n=1 Tax=Rudanella paleaurantiibacter TaxID=2614655 RepID=A0A7J5TZK4_9BACT|nr:site-specific integrase [Rudanella paleaurantiibacter]KAB7730918.1 tyrosine-type recombinase/integrase [Rudanella paleaurantiibacter]